MSQAQRFFSQARDDAATRAEAARSKAGDPCRQGRAGDVRQSCRLAWVSAPGGAYVELRAGVATLGAVHPETHGGRGAFTWRSDMPGARRMPMHAISLEKAKGALLFSIEQFFIAINHPLPPGWRP